MVEAYLTYKQFPELFDAIFATGNKLVETTQVINDETWILSCYKYNGKYYLTFTQSPTRRSLYVHSKYKSDTSFLKKEWEPLLTSKICVFDVEDAKNFTKISSEDTQDSWAKKIALLTFIDRGWFFKEEGRRATELNSDYAEIMFDDTIGLTVNDRGEFMVFKTDDA